MTKTTRYHESIQSCLGRWHGVDSGTQVSTLSRLPVALIRSLLLAGSDSVTPQYYHEGRIWAYHGLICAWWIVNPTPQRMRITVDRCVSWNIPSMRSCQDDGNCKWMSFSGILLSIVGEGVSTLESDQGFDKVRVDDWWSRTTIQGWMYSICQWWTLT